ncbi:MAG: hypothetical protein ACI9ON_003147 [Limisphaerales bacterium]|jgi:hypothetical protein
MKNYVFGRCSIFILLAVVGGCSGTKNLSLDAQFPVPLIKKQPVIVGLHLDEALRTFTYNEVIAKKGEWNVAIGPVQEKLFTNLASGMFSGYKVVDETANSDLDGTLKPEITDLQFSLPEQTRSNFYEVWIRYKFQLYDGEGQVIAEWPLPAYGKASKRDFGSSYAGVEAAAIAACRDAMAFFAINFSKEPQVKAWLDSRSKARPNSGRTPS